MCTVCRVCKEGEASKMAATAAAAAAAAAAPIDRRLSLIASSFISFLLFPFIHHRDVPLAVNAAISPFLFDV